MFYNEFDVYLHDTPKRVPFTRGLRAVSHGCVRVENPYHLMKFVLKGHSTWTPAKIQAYLDQTHEGKVVFLEKKIPVYTDYVTAWVDDNGRIQFRDDVYGKDALLKKAMLSIR